LKSVGAAALNGIITYASGPLSKLGMVLAAGQSAGEIQRIKDLF
jgi:hypothetical protein